MSKDRLRACRIRGHFVTSQCWIGSIVSGMISIALSFSRTGMFIVLGVFIISPCQSVVAGVEHREDPDMNS